MLITLSPNKPRLERSCSALCVIVISLLSLLVFYCIVAAPSLRGRRDGGGRTTSARWQGNPLVMPEMSEPDVDTPPSHCSPAPSVRRFPAGQQPPQVNPSVRVPGLPGESPTSGQLFLEALGQKFPSSCAECWLAPMVKIPSEGQTLWSVPSFGPAQWLIPKCTKWEIKTNLVVLVCFIQLFTPWSEI
ncbi:uncharacterized protein LOC132203819 [Neocloeon triangulifer]|uniref:uncharacterized protein LOC132203819 n=1 Tax=Neocloeon triangulifer TaxID=2078957 RepID=UPI00286F5D76|nr:uncharacterized protein LOC132203819 [Neocloeon triangulifer]